ncbi:hypothetical protein WJX74_006206 [Apatococcus lobatus]|uniref:Thaumatin-like protein n=1 Tax=Apatococcus lobatus TaxID=904363 RepID=A0AAW1SE28_9CHLO
MAVKTCVVAAIALCCVTGSSATLINLINQCPYGVAAFARSGSSATNSYNLGGSGGYQQLDVGSSFPAGLIFASTTGSENNAQVCDLTQLTLNSQSSVSCLLNAVFAEYGASNQHSRWHSQTADQECLLLLPQATQLEITAGANGRDTYDISLVNAYNLPAAIQPVDIVNDSPTAMSNVATSGTEAFKSACPDAYCYSKDDATSTWGCNTGTNYNFIFCP